MDELHPGQRIDTFEIVEVLHSGEMANVYKAEDLLYGQDVVLKIPLDDILNRPILYYQYQNEECLGNYLNHRRVVRFLRRDRSHIYLVLEYIPGVNLRRFLHKEKRLSLETALNYTWKISEGIGYLHNNGIIHLDLKPDNIMVLPDTNIKILDFGLANHLSTTDLLCQDLPGPKGTPYYIAPEQLCGRRDYFQSDIYSLAIILYEMLTGELPFGRSKKLSQVRSRIKKDPIPPRFFERNIPGSIQEIILTALERKPEKRFPTIEEFSSALRNYTDYPTTLRGCLVTKPLPFLWFFSPLGCEDIVDKSSEKQSHKGSEERHILGCIVDHDCADLVIEQVKREALLRGGQITLLTVTEDEIDDHLVKYANEVGGRQFSKRLDRYLANLKRYDLEPTLRIRKGQPVEIIVDTATQLDAEVVILGSPRPQKGLAGIFAGSTIDDVIKNCSGTVIISETVSPAFPPFFTSFKELNAERIAEIDLFLTDTWVHHLNWVSETICAILNGSPGGTLDHHGCQFNEWLAELPEGSGWRELLDAVREPHEKFHQAIEEMAEIAEGAKNNEIRALIQQYHVKVLPLSLSLKEGLQAISQKLGGSHL